MKTCFALSLGFLLCIYSSWDDFEHGSIVGRQRPEPLMNVNFEPILRGLKSDIFLTIMYVLLFCSFSPQSILTCLKGDSLTFSMIISSIKIRTNLIANSLEISNSSTSRLFSTGLKKICRGKFKKITSPSYLKRFQIPHTDPIEMMTCMMGNDWSAVFGKMWKHHRSLIRLLRQMEWEVWKSLLFCKWQRGPQHLHQSPKQYMKSYAGKRRTIFISKSKQGAYIDKLISLLSGWFFLSGWCLRDQLNPYDFEQKVSVDELI